MATGADEEVEVEGATVADTPPAEVVPAVTPAVVPVGVDDAPTFAEVPIGVDEAPTLAVVPETTGTLTGADTVVVRAEVVLPVPPSNGPAAHEG